MTRLSETSLVSLRHFKGVIKTSLHDRVGVQDSFVGALAGGVLHAGAVHALDQDGPFRQVVQVVQQVFGV